MSWRGWLLNLMLLSPALMLTAAGAGLTFWLVVPMEAAWGVWVLSISSFLALIGTLGLAWWVKLAGAEFRRLLQHFAIHYKIPAVHSIAQLPQLNRALNERRIEHVQRMENRANESLRITAHEIRRPLQRLSFAIQLLEENSQLPAGAPEHEVIQDAMAEISNLIDEALWYARVSHGPLPLQLTYFDLRGVVEALIAEHHVLYPDRQFQCQPGGETPQHFQADRKLIVRALNNLMGNAAKYGHGRVMLSWQWSDDELLLTVHDDGPGIPPEQREQVFEPFFTAAAAVAVHGGLGLAIVRGIIDSHGGQIRVTESPLGGAAILLCLPVQGPRALSCHTD